MAMTFASLTGDKNTVGSIASWVRYSKLDTQPILDEAQLLIYSMLRTREMMDILNFNMPVGTATTPLPTGFLDPIGRMYCPSVNLTIVHKDPTFVLRNRNYTETTGTLATNPFTTTNGSASFTVNLPNHGFNQESEISFTGATSANGINFNQGFEIDSITDVNNFVCEGTTAATASGVDGGATITYLCDNLVAAFANWWGIWDEQIHFDCAFIQNLNCQMQYFKTLPLLSSTIQSNFLTNRYPYLLRTACVASAADFMKDSEEFQKQMSELQAKVMLVNTESDMQYRGMELDTEIP